MPVTWCPSCLAPDGGSTPGIALVLGFVGAAAVTWLLGSWLNSGAMFSRHTFGPNFAPMEYTAVGHLFFGLVIASSVVGRATSPVLGWVIFVGVLVGGGLSAGSYLEGRRRRRHLAAITDRSGLAQRQGWRYEELAPELLQRWKSLVGWRASSMPALGVVRGELDGLPFTVFDAETDLNGNRAAPRTRSSTWPNDSSLWYGCSPPTSPPSTAPRRPPTSPDPFRAPQRSPDDRPLFRAAMTSGPARRLTGMETERVTVSTTIEASPEAVFAVLADPSAHAGIDGTGWVRESLDGDRITATGQVFRMAMYHENHPDKDYEMANRIEVFDEPRTIAWQPGQESPETGELGFGGWIWRYDLEATGPSRTTVTLTYDWSAVPPQVREYVQFPPFEPDHLDNSLQHLSDLVTS
jgi:hypothetical protein